MLSVTNVPLLQLVFPIGGNHMIYRKDEKKMKSMTSSEYNRFLAAIKAANDSEDRDALRQIQKQLISTYGVMDDDVDYLIRQFRYHI